MDTRKRARQSPELSSLAATSSRAEACREAAQDEVEAGDDVSLDVHVAVLRSRAVEREQVRVRARDALRCASLSLCPLCRRESRDCGLTLYLMCVRAFDGRAVCIREVECPCMRLLPAAGGPASVARGCAGRAACRCALAAGSHGDQSLRRGCTHTRTRGDVQMAGRGLTCVSVQEIKRLRSLALAREEEFAQERKQLVSKLMARCHRLPNPFRNVHAALDPALAPVVCSVG